MTTTRGMVWALLMLAVAACGDDDSRASVDGGDADGPWTMARYVATYDTDGNGTLDGTEAPLCDPSECTVFCPDATNMVECRDSRFAPLLGHYAPTCAPDGRRPFCDVDGPACIMSGTARCALPWNDPRVIR